MTVTVNKSKFSIPSLKKTPASSEKPLAPLRVESSDLSDVGSSLQSISVELLEVDEYNIRTSVNPKYGEIKRSIESDKADGLLFHVTKIPDTDRYKVVNGTGTRLAVLKELAAEYSGEGQNPFSHATCRIVKDQGVAKRTLGSIKENYARGDNSYIEWAQAIMRLRGEYESEHTGKLSDAEFCRMVSDEGVSLAKSEMVRCRFACGQLMESVPTAMTKGRKSTVFVRNVMDARSSVISEAMKQTGKSRESFSASYDNALMKVGSKVDGVNLDKEGLLKKAEKAFLKENDLTNKVRTSPPLAEQSVENGNADQTGSEGTGMDSTVANSTETPSSTSQQLTKADVLEYLISLDNENFQSLFEQARSVRS